MDPRTQVPLRRCVPRLSNKVTSLFKRPSPWSLCDFPPNPPGGEFSLDPLRAFFRFFTVPVLFLPPLCAIVRFLPLVLGLKRLCLRLFPEKWFSWLPPLRIPHLFPTSSHRFQEFGFPVLVLVFPFLPFSPSFFVCSLSALLPSPLPVP